MIHNEFHKSSDRQEKLVVYYSPNGRNRESLEKISWPITINILKIEVIDGYST